MVFEWGEMSSNGLRKQIMAKELDGEGEKGNRGERESVLTIGK